MAKSVQKADSNDSFVKELSERNALVEYFKGQEIHTIYGPSVVSNLSNDYEMVTLYEFGEQRYDLSFENFKDQLKEYNDGELDAALKRIAN
ncbi:hypothetical protein [Domibacillus robiginosus]|uniref:hypothetical protein n=1 Tax=Domibacillus robiginosus TaxID=1071054 RepID=UPI00067C5303|nr:hypothetical protein [Domibacillus robiginosus]